MAAIPISGKLAYVSGAFGDPQLVHAFIVGMAARGWPRSEIPAIVSAGLSTGTSQPNERRHAVRSSRCCQRAPEYCSTDEHVDRNLQPRRRIEHRCSAATNRTSWRGLRCFDRPLGRDDGRAAIPASTASQSGKEILLPDQQQVIHSVIASQFMSGSSINASDIDKIILHAMLGKNESVLASLAFKLLTADDQVTSFLGENLVLLRFFESESHLSEQHLHFDGVAPSSVQGACGGEGEEERAYRTMCPRPAEGVRADGA